MNRYADLVTDSGLLTLITSSSSSSSAAAAAVLSQLLQSTKITETRGWALDYTPKPPPLAAEPNYFLQAEKPPKNLWLSRKVKPIYTTSHRRTCFAHKVWLV